MAPGKDSYRIAQTAFDAKARRLRRRRVFGAEEVLLMISAALLIGLAAPLIFNIVKWGL